MTTVDTTDRAPAVAAIVLAAGQGTRFAAASDGAHKLLAPYDGMPMVRHVVTAALASRARPVIVVTGHRRNDVCDALSGLSFIEAHNARYASGMASSLKAGISAVPAETAAGIVLLADMPKVSTTLIDFLAAAFADDPTADAVMPVHVGRRGNPVLLARKLFAAITHLDGDEGARRLLKSASHIVEIEGDDAITFDVDTPSALVR